MLNKSCDFLWIAIIASIFSGCGGSRDYTEYNYSPFVDNFGSVQISASMIGEFEDLPGSSRETLRKNPYRLSIGLLDVSSDYVSARITTAEIRSLTDEKSTLISVLPTQNTFAPSFKSDGTFAGFLAENIELREEDYQLILGVELCNDRGCEQKRMSGGLKLEIEKYRSNDAIDKFLSP